MDAKTWASLDKFKQWGSFTDSYPAMVKRFWAPDDKIHEVLMAVAGSATQALHAALYGWDDTEINDLFLKAWANPAIRVKLALDSSQAAGLGERPLLAKWPARVLGSDLVIGRSRLHAISHTKILVADDCVISGSTNFSTSGESKQNNECSVIWDARMAIEAQTKVSLIFDEMWSQPGSKDAIKLLGGAGAEKEAATP